MTRIEAEQLLNTLTAAHSMVTSASIEAAMNGETPAQLEAVEVAAREYIAARERVIKALMQVDSEPKYCDAESVCSECADHNQRIGLTAFGLPRE